MTGFFVGFHPETVETFGLGRQFLHQVVDVLVAFGNRTVERQLCVFWGGVGDVVDEVQRGLGPVVKGVLRCTGTLG